MLISSKIHTVLLPQFRVLGSARKLSSVGWPVVKTMKFGTTINNTKGEAEVLLPGLGFEDFSASADGKIYHPRSWRMMNHIDNCRERAFNDGFLEYKKLEETHYTYISGIIMEKLLPPEKFSLLGRKPYDFAMNVKTDIACMGRTSFQLDHHVLVDVNGSDQTLFHSSIVYVCVDKESRKPTPPPQWWADRYKPLSKFPDKSPLRLAPLKVPTAPSFSHPILVGSLDMDYYGHANNTAYIRFGMDAVYGAYKSNALQDNMNEDIAGARINKMESVYIQDCKMGDQLTGVVWKNGQNVFCVVQNQQGKDVYNQTIQIECNTSQI